MKKALLISTMLIVPLIVITILLVFLYLSENAHPINQLNQCQCPESLLPVCGNDDANYTDKCLADCAGVNIVYDGECQEQDQNCETRCRDGQCLQEVESHCRFRCEGKWLKPVNCKISDEYCENGCGNGQCLTDSLSDLCSKKVTGKGKCRKLVYGHEYDSSIGKCVKKAVGGCSVETPFESLEDCQNICEVHKYLE